MRSRRHVPGRHCVVRHLKDQLVRRSLVERLDQCPEKFGIVDVRRTDDGEPLHPHAPP
jgi:hypothetical protein